MLSIKHARQFFLLMLHLVAVTSYPTGGNGLTDGDNSRKENTNAGARIIPTKSEPKRAWLEVGPGKAGEKEMEETTTTSSLTNEITPVTAVKSDLEVNNTTLFNTEEGGNEDSSHLLTKPVVIVPQKTENNGEGSSNHKGESVQKGKCEGVHCSPPPTGVACSEVPLPPPLSLGLPARVCCPVHSCQRENGSVFAHYGVEIEESSIIAAGFGLPSSISSTTTTTTTTTPVPPVQQQFVQSSASGSLARYPLVPVFSPPSGVQVQPPNSPAQSSNYMASSSFYNYNSGSSWPNLQQPSQIAPSQVFNPLLSVGSQPQTAPNAIYPAQGSRLFPLLTNNKFAFPSVQNPIPPQSQYPVPGINSNPAPVSGFPVDNGNSMDRFSRNAAPSFTVPNVNYPGMFLPFAPSDQWAARARRNTFGGFGASTVGFQHIQGVQG